MKLVGRIFGIFLPRCVISQKVLLPSRQSYKLFVGKEFRLFLVVASITKKKDSLLSYSRKKKKSSREQSFLQKLALKLMPNHASIFLFQVKLLKLPIHHFSGPNFWPYVQNFCLFRAIHYSFKASVKAQSSTSM